jgi:hypothetical protein
MQVIPVLTREAIEGEQRLFVLGQPGDRQPTPQAQRQGTRS